MRTAFTAIRGPIIGFALVVSAVSAVADYPGAVVGDQQGVREAVKTPGYSPYAGRNLPTMVLWGDTHMHTNLSLDARAFGVILGP